MSLANKKTVLNEMPLVSIITVSYNSAKTIENTIQSTLNQTYDNIEYIIIDGASTDGTLAIIKGYEALFDEKNIAFKYISEPDKGIYDAMNKGIRMCSGELIGIINSDDWYESNAVEDVVLTYLNNRDVDVFHGLLRYISYDGYPDSILGHHSRLLHQTMIEHPTCFVKSDCYLEIGLFDSNYRSAGDYEWMLRAKKAGRKFLFLNRLIANFRRGGMSESYISGTEILNIQRSYGILSKSKWLCFRFYKYLVRLNNQFN